MENTTPTYNRGDVVESEGTYVCVPCGFTKHFKQGEHFTECISCMAGTADGHEDYTEGLEMWEKAADEKPAEQK